MDDNRVTLEQEGNIAIVRINNPPVNSLSRNVLDGLESILRTVEDGELPNAVILTGTGDYFSAGAELKELAAARNAREAEENVRAVKRLFDRIEAFKIPFIAAINGACMGGGLELALACHIRIADEKARFGFPEINLGLMPGAGGTQRLGRLAGFSKSCELVLTGELISAHDAHGYRMVDRVAPGGKCLDTARDLARVIAGKSRAAVISALKAIRSSLESQMHECMEKETLLFGRLFETTEAKEKIEAFLRKQ